MSSGHHSQQDSSATSGSASKIRNAPHAEEDAGASHGSRRRPPHVRSPVVAGSKFRIPESMSVFERKFESVVRSYHPLPNTRKPNGAAESISKPPHHLPAMEGTPAASATIDTRAAPLWETPVGGASAPKTGPGGGSSLSPFHHVPSFNDVVIVWQHPHGTSDCSSCESRMDGSDEEDEEEDEDERDDGADDSSDADSARRGRRRRHGDGSHNRRDLDTDSVQDPDADADCYEDEMDSLGNRAEDGSYLDEGSSASSEDNFAVGEDISAEEAPARAKFHAASMHSGVSTHPKHRASPSLDSPNSEGPTTTTTTTAAAAAAIVRVAPHAEQQHPQHRGRLPPAPSTMLSKSLSDVAVQTILLGTSALLNRPMRKAPLPSKLLSVLHATSASAAPFAVAAAGNQGMPRGRGNGKPAAARPKIGPSSPAAGSASPASAAGEAAQTLPASVLAASIDSFITSMRSTAEAISAGTAAAVSGSASMAHAGPQAGSILDRAARMRQAPPSKIPQSCFAIEESTMPVGWSVSDLASPVAVPAPTTNTAASAPMTMTPTTTTPKSFQRVLFPSNQPSSRADAIHLTRFYERTMEERRHMSAKEWQQLSSTLFGDSGSLEMSVDGVCGILSRDFAACDLTMSELVRQCWFVCSERGALLDAVKDRYDSLLSCLMTISKRLGTLFGKSYSELQKRYMDLAREHEGLKHRMKRWEEMLLESKKQIVAYEYAMKDVEDDLQELKHLRNVKQRTVLPTEMPTQTKLMGGEVAALLGRDLDVESYDDAVDGPIHPLVNVLVPANAVPVGAGSLGRTGSQLNLINTAAVLERRQSSLLMRPDPLSQLQRMPSSNALQQQQTSTVQVSTPSLSGSGEAPAARRASPSPPPVVVTVAMPSISSPATGKPLSGASPSLSSQQPMFQAPPIKSPSGGNSGASFVFRTFDNGVQCTLIESEEPAFCISLGELSATVDLLSSRVFSMASGPSADRTRGLLRVWRAEEHQCLSLVAERADTLRLPLFSCREALETVMAIVRTLSHRVAAVSDLMPSRDKFLQMMSSSDAMRAKLYECRILLRQHYAHLKSEVASIRQEYIENQLDWLARAKEIVQMAADAAVAAGPACKKGEDAVSSKEAGMTEEDEAPSVAAEAEDGSGDDSCYSRLQQQQFEKIRSLASGLYDSMLQWDARHAAASGGSSPTSSGSSVSLSSDASTSADDDVPSRVSGDGRQLPKVGRNGRSNYGNVELSALGRRTSSKILSRNRKVRRIQKLVRKVEEQLHSIAHVQDECTARLTVTRPQNRVKLMRGASMSVANASSSMYVLPTATTLAATAASPTAGSSSNSFGVPVQLISGQSSTALIVVKDAVAQTVSESEIAALRQRSRSLLRLTDASSPQFGKPLLLLSPSAASASATALSPAAHRRNFSAVDSPFSPLAAVGSARFAVETTEEEDEDGRLRRGHPRSLSVRVLSQVGQGQDGNKERQTQEPLAEQLLSDMRCVSLIMEIARTSPNETLKSTTWTSRCAEILIDRYWLELLADVGTVSGDGRFADGGGGRDSDRCSGNSGNSSSSSSNSSNSSNSSSSGILLDILGLAKRKTAMQSLWVYAQEQNVGDEALANRFLRELIAACRFHRKRDPVVDLYARVLFGEWPQELLVLILQFRALCNRTDAFIGGIELSALVQDILLRAAEAEAASSTQQQQHQHHHHHHHHTVSSGPHLSVTNDPFSSGSESGSVQSATSSPIASSRFLDVLGHMTTASGDGQYGGLLGHHSSQPAPAPAPQQQQQQQRQQQSVFNSINMRSWGVVSFQRCADAFDACLPMLKALGVGAIGVYRSGSASDLGSPSLPPPPPPPAAQQQTFAALSLMVQQFRQSASERWKSTNVVPEHTLRKMIGRKYDVAMQQSLSSLALSSPAKALLPLSSLASSSSTPIAAAGSVSKPKKTVLSAALQNAEAAVDDRSLAKDAVHPEVLERMRDEDLSRPFNRFFVGVFDCSILLASLIQESFSIGCAFPASSTSPSFFS